MSLRRLFGKKSFGPGLFLLAFLLKFAGCPAYAQSFAFTYQGHLTDGGAQANGAYDLQFGLYTTNAGGSPVGGLITNSGVAVTSGLFVTTLDFGDVFDGSASWLEIGVRSHGSSGAFVILFPRQSLSPAPFALYSLNAGARFTNIYSLDGSALTNLQATNMEGLGSMAFQSTNSPTFSNATNNGPLSVGGDLTLGVDSSGVPANYNLLAGGALNWNPSARGAGIWLNTNHSYEPELQFNGSGSASFTFGEDETGKADIHFGGSGHYHTFFVMQYDEDRMNATNPILGYSTPLGFALNVWSNGLVAHYGAWQFQALDTNGNNILYWRDKWGQFPGYNQLQQEPVGHIAGGFTGSAILWGGAVLTNALVRGVGTIVTVSNYNLDFGPGSPDFVELDMASDLIIATANVNLPSQAQKKELVLRPGLSARNIQFPTNWIWENDTGDASAPASLAAGRFMHVSLLALGTGGTNIYAHARYGLDVTVVDPDAAAFFSATGITNGPQQSAVNQLCLNLKAHGLWTKLIAFYPFTGDTGNGLANRADLKGSYPITWSGGVTHDANGVTGDQSTGYGNTGIIPAGVFGSPNNGMLFVWIKAPETPAYQGWFIGALDYSPAVYFGLSRGGNGMVIEGLNALLAGDSAFASQGADFRGFAAANRTASGSQTGYVNGAAAPDFTDTPAAGLGAREPIFILAKDSDSVPTNFSDATLSAAGVGQNFSSSDMTQLIADVTAFETVLGRQ